jgi:hypothetical protein
MCHDYCGCVLLESRDNEGVFAGHTDDPLAAIFRRRPVEMGTEEGGQWLKAKFLIG